LISAFSRRPKVDVVNLPAAGIRGDNGNPVLAPDRPH
jgi:hypothetical protein